MSATSRARAPRTHRRLRGIAGAFTVVAVLATAVGGFLHTSWGHPLLSKLSGSSCPFARGVLEPQKRDELRRLGLSRQPHSAERAPDQPALGSALGTASRQQIEGWATAHGLACKVESKGAGLACGSPAAAGNEPGSASESLYFRFNARGSLVGVLSMQRTSDAERAVALAAADEAELRARVGEPTRAAGDLRVAYLASGPLRQGRAEHRFSDFAASAAVTNLGASGYLVTRDSELVD